jgi:menaquinone-dependent protoporphyrinogen IX oxidase
MKNIVVYYSRKGSNAYLAKKIAGELNCPMEVIMPRMNAFIFFMLNINPGIRRLKSTIHDYDRVILVGPIFMGRFIPPLKSFIKRYRGQIRELVFVTCCGSTYEKKDEKFGHGLVFEKVRAMVNGKLSLTQAFPVGLVLPEEQRDDPDAFMKAHLNNDTFKGDIEEHFREFMARL